MNKLLHIDSLFSYYDESMALQDVSMEIDHGETVSILGRNGAGKTTLIRSIMGTGGVRCEGAITYDGTDLLPLQTERRANLGIAWIPEDRQVFPDLTVRENLEMGRISSTGDEIGLEGMFELFPVLRQRQGQLGGTLSGGEQQMLVIARALLTNPDLILVDEPFEGLMPSLVTDVRDVLEDLSTEGFSILIVEQKADITLEMSDRSYILDNGAVVHGGESSEIKQNENILQKHIGVK